MANIFLPSVNLNGNSYNVQELRLNEDAFRIEHTRRLKSQWTQEAEQDIRAFFNLNAESFVSEALAEDVFTTISREVKAEQDRCWKEAGF